MLLNILTFGAGAIGTYTGGSLALAGHQVVFIERPEVVDTLRERGLRLDLTLDHRRKHAAPGVEGAHAAQVIRPQSFVCVSSLAEALQYGPFDVALFALKSYDTPGALAGMAPFADKIPPLLCLSNGVDNEAAIARQLGNDRVIYGTVTSAIGRRGPGDIVLEKLRGVGIGAGHALSEKLVAALNAAYLNARLYPDPLSMKWSKLLTNLIANPTSAILDMTAAEVFANQDLFRIEIQMLRECLAVMEAQHLQVVDLPGTPVRGLAFAARLPLWLSQPLLGRAAGRGRGAKMPSFHIDLYSGRGQSEVEYLHGAVVREGRRAGIATPVNQVLTDILMSLTRKEIPLAEYARQPEKLLTKLTPK